MRARTEPGAAWFKLARDRELLLAPLDGAHLGELATLSSDEAVLRFVATCVRGSRGDGWRHRRYKPSAITALLQARSDWYRRAFVFCSILASTQAKQIEAAQSAATVRAAGAAKLALHRQLDAHYAQLAAVAPPAEPRAPDPYACPPPSPLPVFWGGPAPVPAECTPPIEPIETTAPAAVLVPVFPVA